MMPTIYKTYMPHTIDLITDVATETLRSHVPFFSERYSGLRVDAADPDMVNAARQLSTKKFVAMNKIDSRKVDEAGILKVDPYLPISTFFMTRDTAGDGVAACRVMWSPTGGIEDLRLPAEQLPAAQQTFFTNLPPGTVGELGALAKVDKSVPFIATLALLREVFLFAEEHAIAYLVGGLEPARLYPSYKQLFGGAITPLSDHTVEFPGIIGPQVPFIIDIHHAYAKQRQSMVGQAVGTRVAAMMIRGFFRRKVPTIES